MLQTFLRYDNEDLILAVRANLPEGSINERDGAIPYGVHNVAQGAIIEIAADAPQQSTRERRLVFPILTQDELDTLYDIRDGVHGRPVYWSTELQPQIAVVVLEVLSKPWPVPGQDYADVRFKVRAMLRPVIEVLATP